MTKRIIVSFLMVLFISTLAMAQQAYKFSKVLYSGTVHGVTVDPDDNIWISARSANSAAGLSSTGSILVLNADGTTKDTLKRTDFLGTNGGQGVGISTGPDGNIYSSHFDCIVKWDYRTRTALKWVIPYDTPDGETVTTAVADENGNVVVSFLFPRNAGHGALYLDEDLNVIGPVVASSEPNLPTIARCIAMTPDGNDLYFPCSDKGTLTEGGVAHYHSDNGVYDSYTYKGLVRTLGKDAAGNDIPIQDISIDLNNPNLLWIGVDATGSTPIVPARYECWDLKTGKKLFSIISPIDIAFNGGTAETFANGGFATPRGFCLSNDGKKAYICDMNRGVLEYELVESNWEFEKVIYRGSIHGVVVDDDDNIWCNVYGSSSTMGTTRGGMYIMNPDGTAKANFSEVTINGTTYPLMRVGGADVNDAAENPGTGISIHPNGTIYSSHGRALIKWDSKTMTPLAWAVPKNGFNLTTAAGDDNGNVIVTTVTSGRTNGVLLLNEDLETMDPIIQGDDNLPGITRDLALTPDGNDLFIAVTSEVASTGHWHSDGGTWGEYKFVRFIGDYGSLAQDVNLDAKGRLWIGVDGWDGKIARHYCYDLNTMQIVDVIEAIITGSNAAVPADQFDIGNFYSPRGLAFNKAGTKAYVIDFNTGMHQYKLKDAQSAVGQPKVIPDGFVLSQNYPNPFNPTTNFSYSVPKASDVKIVVYDLFGREIKTLVNETKVAGTYSITWNGRDNNNRQVATGVYFYKMKAAGFEKTMKMMLMK
jgi:sugar lactone lactonase YvrE